MSLSCWQANSRCYEQLLFSYIRNKAGVYSEGCGGMRAFWQLLLIRQWKHKMPVALGDLLNKTVLKTAKQPVARTLLSVSRAQLYE